MSLEQFYSLIENALTIVYFPVNRVQKLANRCQERHGNPLYTCQKGPFVLTPYHQISFNITRTERKSLLSADTANSLQEK